MNIITAFATSDGINIDRHFGTSKRFDIYEINTDQKTYTRIDIRCIDNACQNRNHDDKRIEAVADAISDCNYVFAERSGNLARLILEKKNIQAVDVERPIKDVIDNLLYGKVKLIDQRYMESRMYSDNPNFAKLQKKHPCLSEYANVNSARLHLPVSPTCNIQCKFCTRQFDKSLIRPGVSSLVIKPEEAVETVKKAKEICPELTVVGIAGPGDTLATDYALETFKAVKDEYPDLINCLSTNGFYLPSKVEKIAEIGIETITVTVNAIDPEIEAKIVDYVIDENGVKHEGVEGASLLIEHQLQGIKRAAELGILVKINSVFVPGVNDKHIKDVAKKASELGASILNIIPLIPQNEMADIPEPSCLEMDEVRKEAGQYIEVFRHCKHCRADALGIPGKGKDLHNELYKGRKEVAAETFSHG